MEQKIKDLNIINEWCGWKQLYTYKFVELWKTPTMYLVCYKYGRIFTFCKSFDEAKKSIIDVYNKGLEKK